MHICKLFRPLIAATVAITFLAAAKTTALAGGGPAPTGPVYSAAEITSPSAQYDLATWAFKITPKGVPYGWLQRKTSAATYLSERIPVAYGDDGFWAFPFAPDTKFDSSAQLSANDNGECAISNAGTLSFLPAAGSIRKYPLNRGFGTGANIAQNGKMAVAAPYSGDVAVWNNSQTVVGLRIPDEYQVNSYQVPVISPNGKYVAVQLKPVSPAVWLPSTSSVRIAIFTLQRNGEYSRRLYWMPGVQTLIGINNNGRVLMQANYGTGNLSTYAVVMDAGSGKTVYKVNGYPKGINNSNWVALAALEIRKDPAYPVMVNAIFVPNKGLFYLDEQVEGSSSGDVFFRGAIRGLADTGDILLSSNDNANELYLLKVKK